MNDTPSRNIKTGGDPRALADYTTLRNEMSKLTHPARPDVNWHIVEKLSLSLFEQNGVELQTLSWYTLARTHLAGLPGLNEGLAILEALISHQWGGLWPQPVHARMEILTGLSLRMQQLMRTLPLSYGDLGQLYLAEQQLTSLGAVLQRLELKHLSQLDTLRLLMHNSAVRLENSEGTPATGSGIQPGIVLPAAVLTAQDGIAGSGRAAVENTRSPAEVKRVYVAQPAAQEERATTSLKPWQSFTAGMCTMLVAGAAVLWGWQILHRPDPLQAELSASLAPLPTLIPPAQREILRSQSAVPADFLTQTQQQLVRLEKLSPVWNVEFGRQLAEQAQALLPEQGRPLMQQWQQRIDTGVIPAESLNGWHQGMAALQQLTDRLNGLDEKRGQYMTVSELKSAVFTMMTYFRQSIPAEEQLRAISLQKGDSPARQQQILRAEQHLRALGFTLMQEKEKGLAGNDERAGGEPLRSGLSEISQQ